MRSKSDSGFTLVEVLIALGVLLTIWLAAARLTIAAAAANATARAITLASTLATEKLEELRALPLDDERLAVTGPEALRVDVEGHHDEPLPQFVRRWAIEPTPSAPDRAIGITVLVRPFGSRGDAYLTTIKTRKACCAE